MKKFFVFLIAVLAVAAMCSFAAAEDYSVETVPAEPFNWAYLGTIAGSAAFTLLVVQFVKVPLDKVWKIPTRLLAYAISLITMVTAAAFTGNVTADGVLLAVFNAFVAATSAYGMYEITFAKAETKPPKE